MRKIEILNITGKATIPVYVCYVLSSSSNDFKAAIIDIVDTLIADDFISSVIESISRHHLCHELTVCVISFNILPH